MKKIFKRLITFFVGMPALLLIIVFFPGHNHLLLNLVAILFSILGAVEFRNIISHKNLKILPFEAVILGALGPTAWTLVVSFGVTGHIVAGVCIIGATWLFSSQIFVTGEKLEYSINRVTSGFAVMIYPGLFMAWIVQMSVLRESEMVIMVFFLIVLLNDAAAWLAGNLFGKNNRGLIAASPNKSIAGFIGGIAVSVIIGILAASFLPEAFVSSVMPPSLAAAILGFVTGCAAILGDLGESALKRSAGVKDSGTLILGRGGALDSIDSLCLAAPVFYIVFRLLFLA